MLVISIGQGAADWPIKIFNTSHYYASTAETKTDDPNLKVAYIYTKYIQPIFVEAPEAIDFLFICEF